MAGLIESKPYSPNKLMTLLDAKYMIDDFIDDCPEPYRDIKIRLSNESGYKDYAYLVKSSGNRIMTLGDIEDIINKCIGNSPVFVGRFGDTLSNKTSDIYALSDMLMYINKHVILDKFLYPTDEPNTIDLYIPDIMIDLGTSVGKDKIQLI
jgi:hypothetical protein